MNLTVYQAALILHRVLVNTLILHPILMLLKQPNQVITIQGIPGVIISCKAAIYYGRFTGPQIIKQVYLLLHGLTALHKTDCITIMLTRKIIFITAQNISMHLQLTVVFLK